MATSAATSPLDLNALKQAVDLVGKSRSDEAANLESTISDPLARKLIEWLVLRSDDTTADVRALRRVHRRQSELAEHRHVAPAGGGDAVAGAQRPDDRARLLQDRSAAHRQGQIRAGARAAVARRQRRRPPDDQRRLAQRRLLRRSRSPGPRHVRRPHHRRRRQGAHGRPALCRGRRRRIAGGASSRRHAACDRQSARRGHQQGRQRQGAARSRAGGGPARRRLYFQPRAVPAPRRQDRRGRPLDDLGAARSRRAARRRSMVGRAAGPGAQAARPRQRQNGL